MKFYIKFIYINYIFNLANNVITNKKNILNNKKITIKGAKGQNIFEILSQVLTNQDVPFINKYDNIFLKEDIFLYKINYQQLQQFILKNFNIKIKNHKSLIKIKSQKNYWQDYSVNILNYNYSMISNQDPNKKNNDNKNISNNHHYNLQYNIQSNNNLWEEIENNIKIINCPYFINKNIGLVSVNTNKNNHKILEKLFKSIEENNNFFFTITIDFLIIKNKNNKAKNPIHINNDLLNHIQEYFYNKNNIDNNKGFKPIELFYENQVFIIESTYQHKLCTMNNIPVVFNDQTEIIIEKKEMLENINKFEKINKYIITKEKFYDGITLYIHPLLKNKKILVYFLPIITDQLDNNIFYNKSLSSTFFVEPNKKFVLGGFNKNNKQNNIKSISWFKKIPIIKNFFQNNINKNYKEQMIITINVNINYNH
jgi:hypothetical protein